MVRPIMETTNQSKSDLLLEQEKIQKCRDDCDKLNGAVFYKTRKNKNIFHIMRDEITELKAAEVLHEKQVASQLEKFKWQMEDMNLII